MVITCIQISAHTQLSFAESVFFVRSETFLFGTLEITSMEKFFMKSCKELMTTLLMLNISSNAIFGCVTRLVQVYPKSPIFPQSS